MDDTPISYIDVKNKYPEATADVERRIRASRAKSKNDPFESFDWFVHFGQTMGYPGRPALKCMRVYAKQGKRIMRISLLYDMENNVITGNWSF